MRSYGKALAAAVLTALCIGAAAPVHAASVTAAALTAAEAGKADRSTPLGTVETALTAVKALDMDTFNSCTDNVRRDGTSVRVTMFGSSGELSESDREWGQALFSGLSWSAGTVVEDGGTAWISLKITNGDFSGVIDTVMKEAVSAALANRSNGVDEQKRMLSLIQEAQKTSVTLDVTAKAVKTDGTWKVHLDEDLVNAVCGNMLKGIGDSADAVESMAESFASLAADSIGSWSGYGAAAAREILDSAELQQEIADAIDAADLKGQLEQALRDAFR